MITRQSIGIGPDGPGRADFYGFTDSPFSLAADPAFFYESGSHRATLDALKQSLAHKQPFTIVTGAHGSGKTMICRTFIDRLDVRSFSSYLAAPVTSFAELLQTMLSDLGVVSKDAATGGRLAALSAHRLLGVLHDFLLSLVSIGATAVLIIDEAHHLPGELLEEIRLLANLETDDGTLLRIVLVGRPDLLDRFGDEETLALDQRISHRAELSALTRDEVDGYIAHRVAVASPRSRVTFQRRAVDAVHTVTGGVPRLVNQLCDHALAIGAEQRSQVISFGAIEQAAGTLGLQTASDGSRWSWRRLAAIGS